MAPHRVTLLEVARRAGVSRTTASFVLTGREDMRISEETRHRVLRVAGELQYRPNLVSRSLRTKVTRTIALISDTIATEQYAGRVVYGSLAAAVEHEHLLLIGETEGDPALEARLVADFIDHQVDGFVYAAMYTRQVRVPKTLRGQRLVLLNCTTADGRTPAVIPDEVSAGRAVASALLAAGHRAGIHVVGEPATQVVAGAERIAGIAEALTAAGTRLDGTIPCAWWPEAAYDAVRAFLDAGGRATAFITMNDRVAFGAYQALAAAGLRVPDDVSVISFDDSDLAAWLRPPLTSVALPHQDLGRRAIEVLLGVHPGPRVERLAMPLRARDSIARPAAADGPRRRAAAATPK